MFRSAFWMLLFWSQMLWAEALHFRLQAPHGTVTEHDFAGKHLLLSLGYTSCPDICPTTLYEMAQTLKALPQPEKLQMAFVTIDPVNDEIQRLNAYTRYFDPRILGLSGEMAEIEALAEQLGATFGYRVDGKKISTPQAGIPYTVYHSTLLYLFSPTGELLDVYDYQMGAEDLTAALAEVLGGEVSTPQEALPAAKKQDLAPLNCPLPETFTAAESALTLADINPNIQAEKKVLLLNLWALWCEPCRQELPLLDAFQAADVQIATLNLGDDAAAIEALFQDLKLQHLQPQRSDDDLLKRFQAFGLPFSALFVDGVYRAYHQGLLQESHLQALQAFAQCL